jgi:hypothetical protein
METTNDVYNKLNLKEKIFHNIYLSITINYFNSIYNN